jgi:hypothetical protein
MEMARSEIGGRRMKGLRERSDEATGFGAQRVEKSGSRTEVHGAERKEAAGSGVGAETSKSWRRYSGARNVAEKGA